jgi:RDD family
MAHKPQEVITQEAFSVAPELIGLPLARPMRRGVAMLVDLAIVGILVNVAGGTLFGLALVWVLFRLSSRPSVNGGWRFTRLALRGAAALLVLVVAQKIWHRAERSMGKVADAAVMGMVDGGEKSGSGDRKAVFSDIGMAAGFVKLENADDEDDARPIAKDLVRDMRSTGMKDADIRQTLESVAGNDGSKHPWMASVLMAAADSAHVGRAAPAPVLRPDSLARAYVAAVRAKDTAAARTVARPLGVALAADTLHRLNGAVARLTAEKTAAAQQVDALKEQNDALEKRGLLHLIATVADDLGLSLGWVGLYFTAFTALWRGQTPGKRMVGIRVMRLEGQKITLWASFERFGGYAASIFTGLLGFAQIFWDKNRQALHDKISETVVVRV